MKIQTKLIFGGLLGLLALNSHAFEVQTITPAGTDIDPTTRQIRIQFSQAVAAVGAAGSVPVKITPTLACSWRWIANNILVCDLPESSNLKPSTSYRIEVAAGFKASNGSTLKQTMVQNFSTPFAKVERAFFERWIDVKTAIVGVQFNQPVTIASAEKALYLADSRGNRYTVRATPTQPFTNSEDKNKKPTVVPMYDTLNVQTIMPLPANETFTVRYLAGLQNPESPTISQAKGKYDDFELETFGDFRVLGLKCRQLGTKEDMFLEVGKADARLCSPERNIRLVFSTPVQPSQLKTRVNLSPVPALPKRETDDGRVETYNPWDDEEDNSSILSQSKGSGDISQVLPYAWQYERNYDLTLAAGVRDMFGRALAVPGKISFKTGARESNFDIFNTHGVIEKGIGNDIPIVISNLSQLDYAYGRRTLLFGETAVKLSKKVTRSNKVAYKFPMGLNELLNGQSGIVRGKMTSIPQATWYPEGKDFTAQLTPWNVQAKVGHAGGLVWATNFADGKPVPLARVRILKASWTEYFGVPQVLATVETNMFGIAELPGLASMDPYLDGMDQRCIDCYDEEGNQKPGREAQQLFVEVIGNEDMAVLPLDYDHKISMYDVSGGDLYSYNSGRYDHLKAWGMTAQGIYRPGDTLDYKIFVRDQNNTGLNAPPAGTYKLKLNDPQGKTVYENNNVQLNAFGAFSGSYAIPSVGAVGWYDFELTANFGKNTAKEDIERSYYPLRVLVTDFTPAPFKVEVQPQAKTATAGQKFSVETLASLHAGGPYAEAATAINATINSDYIKPKIQGGDSYNFNYSSDPEYYGGSETLFEGEGNLNAQGRLLTEVKLAETKLLFGKLRIESAVRDERGKNVAASSSLTYQARDRYVGVKPRDWLMSTNKPSTFDVIVVDAQGQLQAGVPISGKLEYEQVTAVRSKSAGNAYTTSYTREFVSAGSCQATSQTTGAASCTLSVKKAGTYRFTANIKDSQGRSHFSQTTTWATGSDGLVWDQESPNLLPITPEKTEYKVGETARYFIRNPFPGAQALVTIERLGVMKHWLIDLPTNTEVLSFPVEEDFAPGFYLSVTVYSPRVDKPVDGKGVDLGKPTFKMGYVKTEVPDVTKRLNVQVKTDREEYRPGDTVSVQVSAKPSTPNAPAEPMEVALVALDASVFELISNKKQAFDPVEGFSGLETLDMENFSLLLNLIGRQKFEKKGANTGGDGGNGASMRTLFKYVSYWNPNLNLAAGETQTVQFKAPDNLTGWKIFAVTTTANARMGLGEGTFKVNKPLELRPIMPNQVLAGDRFVGGFSVMNRTPNPQSVQINVKVTGNGEAAPLSQTLQLAPWQRMPFFLPVQARTQGQATFVATAKAGAEQDGLQQNVPILAVRARDSIAVFGSLAEKALSHAIKYPAGLNPQAGGLTAQITTSAVSDVQGSFEYVRNYPYYCWEQKLTKAMFAAQYQQLKPYFDKNWVWQESQTLPQNTLALAVNYQAYSGGMTFWDGQDAHVDPYLSAYTALSFQWLRQGGYAVPDGVEKKLHEYLQKMLRTDDTLPSWYDKPMQATVRAMAMAALSAEPKNLAKEDFDRLTPVLGQMSVFGQALLLEASLARPALKNWRKTLYQQLMNAREDQAGGRVSFKDKRGEAWNRWLLSNDQANCAVLSAMTAYGATDEGEKLVGDLPVRLANSVRLLRKKVWWTSTQDNLFCANAMIDYAKRYESTEPDLTVSAKFNAETIGITPSLEGYKAQAELKRPMQMADIDKTHTVTLSKQGDGRAYYVLRLDYEKTKGGDTPTLNGFEVIREYSVRQGKKWTKITPTTVLKRGDLVRVDLFVITGGERAFVVVDDPVPGAFEPVNRDLATTSSSDADTVWDGASDSYWRKFGDWRYYDSGDWAFYHRELRHQAVRYYADHLAAGKYHMAYLAQVIAEGQFAAQGTRAEEMYNPEIYGRAINGVISVGK